MPLKFNWNKCKLETISYGHGITTTPLQAASVYSTLVNGGKQVVPSLIKERSIEEGRSLISANTSNSIKRILRKLLPMKTELHILRIKKVTMLEEKQEQRRVR